jgi:hypothetical protein
MPFKFEDVTAILSFGETPTALQVASAVPFKQMESKTEIVSTPLYIRPHLVEQDAKLDAFIEGNPEEPRLRTQLVTGPPGSGKTSFLALWARMYARNNKKRVLVVNYRDEKPLQLLKLTQTKAEYCEIKGARVVHKFEDCLEDEEGTVDLVVFDGVRTSVEICSRISSILNGELSTGKISKIMRATSLSFVIRGQDGIRGEHFDQMCFSSWTFEDHKAAFESFRVAGLLGKKIVDDAVEVTKHLQSIDAGVDGMDLGTEEENEGEAKQGSTTPSGKDVEFYAERKYFYAGGNARFMYRFTMDKLVEDLNFHFARVTNWEVFSSNDLPGAELAAVNTLMQQFPDAAGFPKCVAVSRYVLLYASERCTGRLVDAVYAIANLTGNPSLKGWAFELNQLELIKTVLKTILASDAAAAEDLYIGTEEGLAFTPRDETSYNGLTFPLNWNFQDDVTTIIWCLKWNQGCFDVALYNNGTLVTLQFTRQDDHSLKLQFISQLRKAIKDTGKEVERVVHIGVVEGDVSTFRFKAAEGTGRRGNCETVYVVKICHTSALKKIRAPTAHGTLEILELSRGYEISVHNNTKLSPSPGLTIANKRKKG